VVALVWLINGLFAKVLGLVPRHEDIVARMTGEASADVVVVLIGLGEIALAMVILWGRYPRALAILQISLVVLMNILEVWRAGDLLLWGKANAAFALSFCVLVYYHGIILGGRLGHNSTQQ